MNNLPPTIVSAFQLVDRLFKLKFADSAISFDEQNNVTVELVTRVGKSRLVGKGIDLQSAYLAAITSLERSVDDSRRD